MTSSRVKLRTKYRARSLEEKKKQRKQGNKRKEWISTNGIINMNCILWQFEKKKKFRYKMFEREILARGGRISNWTADRVLEGKRGLVKCTIVKVNPCYCSRSLSLFRISGQPGERERDQSSTCRTSKWILPWFHGPCGDTDPIRESYDPTLAGKVWFHVIL